MRQILPQILLVTAVSAGGLLSPAVHAQGRPTLVLADPVRLAAVAETTPIQANVAAINQATLAVRVAGRVHAVPVAVGDRVAAGEVLASLDSRPLEAALAAARAALQAARFQREAEAARVALAEQTLRRLRNLDNSAALARGALEDAEQALRLARAAAGEAGARVDAARAAVRTAELDFEDREVVAPFAGVVIERQAGPGAYLRVGEAVAVLLDTGSLEVVSDMPAGLAKALAPGAELGGERASGRPVRVRSVLPVEDVRTRTRRVHLALLGPAEGPPLAVGESLQLGVPRGGERRVQSVSKDALIRDRDGWVVFVVEDGAAARRAVAVGAFIGGRVEVVTGLREGEAVVVRGNERLRPGQPLAVREPPR